MVLRPLRRNITPRLVLLWRRQNAEAAHAIRQRRAIANVGITAPLVPRLVGVRGTVRTLERPECQSAGVGQRAIFAWRKARLETDARVLRCRIVVAVTVKAEVARRVARVAFV